MPSETLSQKFADVVQITDVSHETTTPPSAAPPLDAMMKPTPQQPDPSGLPKNLTATLEPNVDLMIQVFQNCPVICLSQGLDGRVGTFLLCERLNDPEGRALEYNVTALLQGKENPLYSIYARHILAGLPGVSSLILGISLKGAANNDGKEPLKSNQGRHEMKLLIDQVVEKCRILGL